MNNPTLVVASPASCPRRFARKYRLSWEFPLIREFSADQEARADGHDRDLFADNKMVGQCALSATRVFHARLIDEAPRGLTEVVFAGNFTRFADSPDAGSPCLVVSSGTQLVHEVRERHAALIPSLASVWADCSLPAHDVLAHVLCFVGFPWPRIGNFRSGEELQRCCAWLCRL